MLSSLRIFNALPVVEFSRQPCCNSVQALTVGACHSGGLMGPGVRWRVDRDDVASVFPRMRAALVDLAGNVSSSG